MMIWMRIWTGRTGRQAEETAHPAWKGKSLRTRRFRNLRREINFRTDFFCNRRKDEAPGSIY